MKDFDFSDLGDAMKAMQDAYAGGLSAMNAAGEAAADETDPTHRILIDVDLSARVEGHAYVVDAHLEFLADLNSILQAEGGDVASLLGGLGVELSDEEKSQVVEQLGSPRCVGRLEKAEIKKLELFSDEGRETAELNSAGTILATLTEGKISFAFESVLSFPELQAAKTIFCAIPSHEKMQENVSVDVKKLTTPIKFAWTEKENDGLKISGKLKIEPLE